MGEGVENHAITIKGRKQVLYAKIMEEGSFNLKDSML